MSRISSLLALVLVLAPQLTAAQAATARPATAAPQAPRAAVTELFSSSGGSVTIGGAEVKYRATTGTLALKHANGKTKANIFFVAYTREGQDPRSRPITFTYNGGPGSPAIWLHMGLMGPKRVQMAPDGFQPAPPYQLVDNDQSPLDLTDIVLLDPVNTGFSRAAEGEALSQFTGVRGDIESVAEFIRVYLNTFERWRSPKFLLGESYGTMRSAGVAEELQTRHGVELNGIVLVSSILDYQSKGYVPGNDYPYANFLPTMAATAWYHKKLAPELQGDLKKTVDEARTFAFGEYLQALVKGSRLTSAERKAIAQKVARYSGLSVEYIEQSNLRVTDPRFRKELLRDRGVMIGRLDGRYTALDADDAGEDQEFDPSNHALTGPYSALFLDYVKKELGYQSEVPYFTSGQVQPWDYRPFQNRYLNLVESLRATMARNPALRVFVANGYYDFATPFGGTEYTFDHLGYEPTYGERVTMKYYEGGHMMYIIPEQLRALKRDLTGFYAGGVRP